MIMWIYFKLKLYCINYFIRILSCNSAHAEDNKHNETKKVKGETG